MGHLGLVRAPQVWLISFISQQHLEQKSPCGDKPRYRNSQAVSSTRQWGDLNAHVAQSLDGTVPSYRHNLGWSSLSYHRHLWGCWHLRASPDSASRDREISHNVWRGIRGALCGNNHCIARSMLTYDRYACGEASFLSRSGRPPLLHWPPSRTPSHRPACPQPCIALAAGCGCQSLREENLAGKVRANY